MHINGGISLLNGLPLSEKQLCVHSRGQRIWETRSIMSDVSKRCLMSVNDILASFETRTGVFIHRPTVTVHCLLYWQQLHLSFLKFMLVSSVILRLQSQLHVIVKITWALLWSVLNSFFRLLVAFRERLKEDLRPTKRLDD